MVVVALILKEFETAEEADEAIGGNALTGWNVMPGQRYLVVDQTNPEAHTITTLTINAGSDDFN